MEVKSFVLQFSLKSVPEKIVPNSFSNTILYFRQTMSKYFIKTSGNCVKLQRKKFYKAFFL